MASSKQWDELWMNLAIQIANFSKDPRTKVASVIVTEDNTTVVAIGYNGDQVGGNNVPDSLEPGASNFIHAETNALIKMNYHDTRNKKMYVTYNPCRQCARQIVNANIKKVYYKCEYRDTSGLDILRNAGIEVVKLDQHWE